VPVVTPAEPRHVEALAVLFEEMDRFYGETELEPFEDRGRQIREALFGDPPAAYALLVWEGAELVGAACYSFLWPAVRATRSLFLKELYVAESHRRTSIGNLLMDGLIDIAKKHNCSRVEWMTDLGNRNAQDFYAARGVEVDKTKLFYRVSI
jgi:GNAT superfamily N-acetyltransferase